MTDFIRMRTLMREKERIGWMVEKANARATQTTAIVTGMPRGGGNQQRMEDDTILLATLKEQYEEVTTELTEARTQLKKDIRYLDSDTYKIIVKMRYIAGARIEYIADSLGYSERQIFRILDRAEKKIRSRQLMAEQKRCH